jgi:NADPH-dependent 2,4-dienoyl-CoA reductase/sulfur reductase-like enzyme
MHVVAIGGSDAGISAALRARELDPSTDVTVVVADAYPNFSICGIPYYISGEVARWQNLAHRSYADLEAAGMQLRLDTVAMGIDVDGHQVWLRNPDGSQEPLTYDRLVVGTGAVPVRPPIEGLHGGGVLGQRDGVHLLHTMADTFWLQRTLDEQRPATALVVGAGYVGLEMAEGLVTRGLRVAQVEALPEVLPTVDRQLGTLVGEELLAHGVDASTSTTVRSVARAPKGSAGRLVVDGTDEGGRSFSRSADLVLVSVGVRPDTELLVAAGAKTGVRGAVVVDERMRTGLPDVYAARDCVVTHHRPSDQGLSHQASD